MRAYGLPRNTDVEFPDVADNIYYARPGSVGKLPGKSGDFHRYSKGASKARLRRYWKRRARQENNLLIQNWD
jgi:hypothetical protein